MEKNKEVICPYCGYIQSDISIEWLYDSNKDIEVMICRYCGLDFNVEIHTETTFSTSKMKESE